MAPPKDVPAFAGPTSTVIPAVNHWSDGSLLAPHEPIRHDLARMERLLQAPFFDGTQPWKVAAFFKWYNDWFYFNVHHHHDIEETIFFPAVKARCDVIPERMAADHEGLLHMLDEIRSMEARFKPLSCGAPAPSPSERRLAAEELRQKVAHMAAELREHIAEEERFFTPVIREKFTKEEHQQLVARIIQAAGLSGNAKLCPWIVHAMYRWAGKDYVEKEMRATMPLPIRFLLDYFWYPKYLKQGVAGLDVLEFEADPSTSAGKSLKRIHSLKAN
ncbi:hypothetical protein KFL_001550140 [Klebsormidium nitens]|uniref:Hemerythrin-like domain-containing protein n=1 Tax=Klebsormidium nitens TaxID=105231 RepID=A0A1Y1HY92_KLENI|nr:hypothetical protein KFL_001550140 [Klebsormidium nitens]|eukprot:GAQ83624.1 hypothetical protein KFL_001550140 [Klebsormidium nitens]